MVPLLVEALRGQVKGICPHPTANEELLAIGPAAVPSLVELLADGTFSANHVILGILDDLGAEALEAARPVFSTWLVSDSLGWRLLAAERLLRLDGVASPRTIEIFKLALDEENASLRLRGARALLNSGQSNRLLAEAVLRELLEHRHESIRKRAAEALGRLPSD